MTTERQSSPPRVADGLLRCILPPGAIGESIRGDLYEEYATRRHGVGRNVWYALQAVRLSIRYLPVRSRSPRQSRGPEYHFIDWSRDVKHTLRRWARRPAFTALTVVTLGLGIGATTAMVSVVDRTLLRALPYPDSHELVTVWNTYPDWRGHEVLDPLWDQIALSYPEYVDWRDGQSAFQSVAVYTTGPSTLTGFGTPARVGFGSTAPSLFPMLGVQPVLGRTFRSGEEGDASLRVAVVSYGFWTSRLGSGLNAIGRSVTVDGEAYEVIGVLPPGFRLRSLAFNARLDVDIWVPAGIFGDADDRGHHRYEAIARLAPGVTLDQATADTGPLLRGDRDPSRQGVRVLSRQNEEVAANRGPLLLLLGAAGTFMLIACVNVAALFTAEIAGRRHELATRSAVGASKGQLTTQLLTEAVSIGLLGALLGIAVSMVGVRLLVGLAPPELMLPDVVPLDVRVLAVATVLGLTTGLLFGVGPALIAPRTHTNTLAFSREAAGITKTMRSQRAMIVVESSLAVVLLVMASLLTRSVLQTQTVDPGFRVEEVVAVNLPVTGPRTQDQQMTQFARLMLERLRGLPGISRVSGSNHIPFGGSGGSSSFEIEGRRVPEGAKLPEAHRRSVLPDFHDMLGIPVLSGRAITAEDDEHARRVAVVSQALAERYWPHTSPLGEIILRDRQRWEIVGVVADILHSDLEGERESTYYFPFFQQPPNQFWLIIESRLPLENLVPQLRTTVTDAAPEVAIGRVERVSELVRQSTATARYRMLLVSAFGAFSMLLAAVGIFGTTARAVVARRRELGIRIALGATRQRVTNSVVLHETRAVLFGIMLGLGLAVLATRSVSGFLFGITPFDPLSFLLAGLGLLLAGGVASYLPARRVASVDPVDVLQPD